jgi:NTE family protein
MKKELSLALGGGGIKGFAHIGVLKRLEELGYSIKSIAGTSAGGLVGALYCAGYTPDEIAEMVIHFDQRSMFSFQNEGPGLLNLNSITQILVKKLGNITFKDLKIKFACTAVDIKTGREYVFCQSSVVDAVLSTIAVPGAFPPKKMDGKEFVDGAVMDPVPVNLARWLSPNIPVIAVCLSYPPDEMTDMHLNPIPTSSPIPAPIIEQFSKLRVAQAFSIFSQSIDLSSKFLAELRLAVDRPDVIIRPDVSQYGIFDVVNPLVLIEKGIAAVDQGAADIQNATSWLASIKRLNKKPLVPARII